MKISYKSFKKVTPEILNHIKSLEAEIFPTPHSLEKLESELSSKFNISIFMAFNESTPIGFKVGFERSKRIYYSWIGGVSPSFRKQGIAKKLMELQHEMAKERGYKIVCTQTDNSFKPMLILNLKHGFDIKGCIQSTGDDYLTLILEKNLQ